MKAYLGTAQFGMQYGITNTKGQLPRKDVFDILDYAFENGITSLDTAFSYGESEKLLGEYDISRFKISTKLPSLSKHQNVNKHLIKKYLYESLTRLHLDRLENLFIHDVNDLISDFSETVFEALEEIRDENLVNNIGVSIYDPNDLLRIEGKEILDIIQAPLNVLDRRILDQAYISILDSNRIKLQARSIYLQGLLLQHPDSIPQSLIMFKHVFYAWHEYVAMLKISKLEGCINYLRPLNFLDSIVTGVSSLSELKEFISALSSNYHEISFENPVELDLIDPRKWL